MTIKKSLARPGNGPRLLMGLVFVFFIGLLSGMMLSFTGLPASKDPRIDSAYMKKLLCGKIRYKDDKNFLKVPAKYSTKDLYLEKKTFEAFVEMQKAAEKDKIRLVIVSGARNFEQQKVIWERKWNNNTGLVDKERVKKIMQFSSMPMTSRHHWGTDLDINSLENSYFESGKGLKEYQWLVKNAGKFGFCQVYTDKKTTKRTGYEMEKWHWSYMPLARTYLSLYKKLITYKDIEGFPGSKAARDLDVIKNYVYGVTECKQADSH